MLISHLDVKGAIVFINTGDNLSYYIKELRFLMSLTFRIHSILIFLQLF